MPDVQPSVQVALIATLRLRIEQHKADPGRRAIFETALREMERLELIREER